MTFIYEKSLYLLSDELRTNLTGSLEMRPLWYRCLNYLSESRFRVFLTQIYMDNYEERDQLGELDQYGQLIRDEMGKLLNNSNMDKISRDLLLFKLNNLKLSMSPLRLIGYDTLDEIPLINYYSELNDDYFQSSDSYNFHVNYYIDRRITMDLKLAQLNNREDRTRYWHIIDQAFNFKPKATNYNTFNNIVLLNGAYYHNNPIVHHSNRPTYMNLASLGSLIGRELAQGFNSKNVMRDKLGSHLTSSNGSRISESSNDELRRSFDCLMNQYQKYYDTDHLVVDDVVKRTLDEDFADNISIKLAYKAARININNNYKYNNFNDTLNLLLPNINFNWKQLFWILYATNHCGHEPPKEFEIEPDDSNELFNFSPREFRVNGPLSNMLEFSQAFNCPLGSPMNPKSKCMVLS